MSNMPHDFVPTLFPTAVAAAFNPALAATVLSMAAQQQANSNQSTENLQTDCMPLPNCLSTITFLLEHSNKMQQCNTNFNNNGAVNNENQETKDGKVFLW